MRHEMFWSECTMYQFVIDKVVKTEESVDRRFRIDNIETHLQECIYVPAYTKYVCKCLL